ncbi:MAG: prepilin-type N-terminal cleavage/methylation domain-containing protein [Candidatus Aminicenantes bacterium]|nr:prepilin-type N-terminal cleavage/methylation domain-containing protein [Candidatus Aminicenantes bacterium]
MAQTEKKRSKGFTLIEVLIGMALVGIAVLGLAEMFTLAVLQNRQADRIANATFLAQQQIDAMRNMTQTEIAAWAGIPFDEPLDLNADGVNDYRRITAVLNTGTLWDIRVLVFSAEHMATDMDELVADPQGHKVRSQIQTLISSR